MKNYINSNFLQIKNEGTSRPIVKLISGALSVTNSSVIYHQSSLIRGYLSSIKFEDSLISALSLVENSIEIVSSTFEFTNMEVENVNASPLHDFIFISFDSIAKIADVNYHDSTTILFN
jgi:hypothetical protein